MFQVSGRLTAGPRTESMVWSASANLRGAAIPTGTGSRAGFNE